MDCHAGARRNASKECRGVTLPHPTPRWTRTVVQAHNKLHWTSLYSYTYPGRTHTNRLGKETGPALEDLPSAHCLCSLWPTGHSPQPWSLDSPSVIDNILRDIKDVKVFSLAICYLLVEILSYWHCSAPLCLLRPLSSEYKVRSVFKNIFWTIAFLVIYNLWEQIFDH